MALDLLGIAEASGTTTPAVRELASQTGASAAFWQLAGRRLILIDKHEVADGFHYIDRFAHRLPETTIFGMTLLAAMPAEVRNRHLRYATSAASAYVNGIASGTVVADSLSSDRAWRVAMVVVHGGNPVGVVGVSRAASPSDRIALRDRRCVMAAALRMGHSNRDNIRPITTSGTISII